jgi:MFS family permease
MSLYEIGLLVSISSVLLVVFQAVGFHRLVNCFSPTKVFIGGALSMVPFVFLTPLASSLSVEMNYTFSASEGGGNNESLVGSGVNVTVLDAEQATQRGWMFVIVGLLRGMCSLISVTIFSTSFMLINNSCSNDDRGAVNGLAMTIASMTKAMGPAIGSSLLAWSFTSGKNIAWVLGHPLNFWLVAMLWFVLGWTAWRVLPKYKLDVHYQANGNEVDFKLFEDKEVADRSGGGGGGGDDDSLVRAELDEESDEQWADI